MLKKVCLGNLFIKYFQLKMYKSLIAALSPVLVLSYGTEDGSSYENAMDIDGIGNPGEGLWTWVHYWNDLGEDGKTPTFHGESVLYITKPAYPFIKWGFCLEMYPYQASESGVMEIPKKTDDDTGEVIQEFVPGRPSKEEVE